MDSILLHFHPKMPLFLVAKLKSLKYDPEKFINWYTGKKNLAEKYQGLAKLKSKKDVFYWVSGYYFWILYIAACIFLASSNIYVALIGVIISPFIVAGYLYGYAYLTNFFKKSKNKLTK